MLNAMQGFIQYFFVGGEVGTTVCETNPPRHLRAGYSDSLADIYNYYTNQFPTQRLKFSHTFTGSPLITKSNYYLSHTRKNAREETGIAC